MSLGRWIMCAFLSFSTTHALSQMIYEPEYLTPDQVKKLNLSEHTLDGVRFFVDPSWDYTFKQFEASGLMKAFQSHVLTNFGLRFSPRRGKANDTVPTGYLFKDGNSLKAVEGMEAAIADPSTGGAANQTFFNAQMQPTLAALSANSSAADLEHMRVYLFRAIIHESTHFWVIRRCRQLLERTSDDIAIYSSIFGAGWLAEGMAENVPMTLDPAVRRQVYRNFYAAFGDPSKKVTYSQFIGEDEENFSVQNFYIGSAMMVEYIKLKYGFKALRGLIEDACVAKGRMERKTGLVYRALRQTPPELWDSTVSYFQQEKSKFNDVLMESK